MKENLMFHSPLKDVLLQYLTKSKQEWAEGTYVMRLRHLHDFGDYLVSIGYQEGAKIDEPIMTAWLSAHKMLSGHTLVNYTSSIRKFARFCSNLTDLQIYELPFYNVDDSYVPYLFSDEEMDTIYDLIDNYSTGNWCRVPYIQLEFPMVIRLLDSCGFRLNELLTTRMTEVDLTNGILKMVNTKGEKQRLVPLDAKMTSLLQLYCREMGLWEKTSSFLFPRKKLTESLEQYDISSRFRRVLVKAGIRSEKSSKRFAREACVHCLRHRFTLRAIKHLLAQGISLEDSVPYLSFYLGHSDITETEDYMKFLAEYFPEEMDKFAAFATQLLPDETIWGDWM